MPERENPFDAPLRSKDTVDKILDKRKGRSSVEPDSETSIQNDILNSTQVGYQTSIPVDQESDALVNSSTSSSTGPKVSKQVAEHVFQRASTPVGKSRYRPTSYRMLDTDVDWIDEHALKAGRRKQDILTDAIALYRDLMEGESE